jgi:NodT family efflux transporter outer membrane factor (OMF) lipoprotein
MNGTMKKVLTPLALAMLMTGCVNLAPKYERPSLPVAAAFPEASPAAGAAAASIGWQKYFADARLQELIRMALANNRDLRVAVANIEQARAAWQIRRADQFPTVNAAVTGSRTPGKDDSITSVYTAGLGVSAFELDLFGRVRNLSQAAQAQFLATEEAARVVRIGLVASVANAYLATLADDELLTLITSTLATRQESLRLVQLKFNQGVVSKVDLDQAVSLVETAKVALAAQQRQGAADRNLLTLLVGQPLPAALPPATPLATTMLADLPAGLPSDLLTTRPDVRGAEQQLIAANANIGAARAAWFPRISLTGTAGSASTELSGLFKGGSFAWTFAPQAVLPIFDAGRNQANLEATRAGREIALAQYERTLQSAFREVADSLAGRATLADQLRAQSAQAEAERSRLRLADLRYRNGVASYLEVLDAERSLFTAQQSVVQVRALQTQNLVTLYKVLGGGWSEAQ